MKSFEDLLEDLCDKHGLGGSRARFIILSLWKGSGGQSLVVEQSVAHLMPVFLENAITSFSGEFRWLSNFFEAEIELDGKLWPSSEHAYQAFKTLDKGDREGIRMEKTPGRAKRAGARLSIREDWPEVKISCMERCLRAKFDQHPVLADKLIATQNRMIVEGNTWGDTFWGVCKGKGTNYLGRLLMSIRQEIR